MLHGWPFGVLGWLPLAALTVHPCVWAGRRTCVCSVSTPQLTVQILPPRWSESTHLPRPHPHPASVPRAPLPLPRGGKRLLSGFHTSALAPFRPLGSGAQRNPNRGGITTRSPCHLPGKSGSSPQSTGARSLRTLLASSAHRGPPPLGPLSPDPRFFFW